MSLRLLSRSLCHSKTNSPCYTCLREKMFEICNGTAINQSDQSRRNSAEFKFLCMQVHQTLLRACEGLVPRLVQYVHVHLNNYYTLQCPSPKLLPHACMREAGLSNRFCPSVSLSVVWSSQAVSPTRPGNEAVWRVVQNHGLQVQCCSNDILQLSIWQLMALAFLPEWVHWEISTY